MLFDQLSSILFVGYFVTAPIDSYIRLEFEFHTHIVRTATCCFSSVIFTIE